MIIGKLLGAIGGLATTYLDGKVAVQKANAEIKVKLDEKVTGRETVLAILKP